MKIRWAGKNMVAWMQQPQHIKQQLLLQRPRLQPRGSILQRLQRQWPLVYPAMDPEPVARD